MGKTLHDNRIVTNVYPSCYFGSIAYFASLIRHESVRIEQFEHFPKQTLRSRCRINTANGIVDLSIPVIKSNGSKTNTNLIVTDESKDWRNIHWKSIRSAYQASPYFEHYESDIKPLILNEHVNLINLNTLITTRILDLLGFNVELTETKSFELDRFAQNAELALKRLEPETATCPYTQVFQGKANYSCSLSILDPLFCEGPMTHKLLLELNQ